MRIPSILAASTLLFACEGTMSSPERVAEDDGHDAAHADGVPETRDGDPVEPGPRDAAPSDGEPAAQADAGSATEPCAVDPQQIFDDVAYLASQALRGRIPGDVGNEMALDFAENELRAAGLEPGGVDGTFRQAFEFRCGHDWCRDHQSGVTENVLARLPGSDPVLANEFVLVGAHIDHLGVGTDGAVYGGADDNASGAAVVLELARMFQRCGLRPARTILFVEWNAEEMGIIGARHYAEHPVVPLAQTRAVYNFDMVGGGDGTGVLLFGGDDAPNRFLTDLMTNAAARAGLTHTIQLVPQKLASDHAPFVEKGVPVCWGFARPDPHPGYHTPADDMSRINLQSLRAVSELFWAALRPLAMGEEGAFAAAP